MLKLLPQTVLVTKDNNPITVCVTVKGKTKPTHTNCFSLELDHNTGELTVQDNNDQRLGCTVKGCLEQYEEAFDLAKWCWKEQIWDGVEAH